MTCPEYIRLPDAYEATLRRWANMMRLPDETGWNKSIAFHRRDAAFAAMTVQKEGYSAYHTDKTGCARESEWSNQLKLRSLFRRLWILPGL
jgi:hypothetical protein